MNQQNFLIFLNYREYYCLSIPKSLKSLAINYFEPRDILH